MVERRGFAGNGTGQSSRAVLRSDPARLRLVHGRPFWTSENPHFESARRLAARFCLPQAADWFVQSCPNQIISSHTYQVEFRYVVTGNRWVLIMGRDGRAVLPRRWQSERVLQRPIKLYLNAPRQQIWQMEQTKCIRRVVPFQLILTACSSVVRLGRVPHLSPSSLPLAALRPLLSLPAPLLAPHSPFCDAYSHFMFRTQPGGGKSRPTWTQCFHCMDALWVDDRAGRDRRRFYHHVTF